MPSIWISGSSCFECDCSSLKHLRTQRKGEALFHCYPVLGLVVGRGDFMFRAAGGRGVVVIPDGFGGHGHEDGLDAAAGLESELGAAIVD